MPLFGRAPVPLSRHHEILWHTFSLVVHHAQLELGIVISLFGKGFPFRRGRCVILLIIGGRSLIIFEFPGISLFGKGFLFRRGRCVSLLIIGDRSLIIFEFPGISLFGQGFLFRRGRYVSLLIIGDRSLIIFEFPKSFDLCTLNTILGDSFFDRSIFIGDNRFLIVAGAPECFNLIEISVRAQPGAAKQHGKNQAEQGSWF